jgi:hypothetical protein
VEARDETAIELQVSLVLLQHNDYAFSFSDCTSPCNTSMSTSG